MNTTTRMGDNRTGNEQHPDRTAAMVAGMEEFPPSSTGSMEGPGIVRIAYAREGAAIGTVPPPPKMRGKAKAAVTALEGVEPTKLTDMLGGRLAFERSGTRLYEALISKLEASGGFTGGPTRADLEHILEEEHRHFAMLDDTMRELGADPTAVTPCADVQATCTAGVMHVIVDPRTTFMQCLEAILVAELADGDGWEMLIAVMRNAGQNDIVAQFEEALANEREHLERVRTWLKAGHGLAPAKGRRKA